jgi:guanosine-3',5'-bis(diphosphate) 3'-pyrophosphohydrolase
MNTTQIILQAARFAAEHHTDQKRKGERAEPYINHPLEVANLLANVGDVDDPELLSAALLHDTIEDCDVTRDEIAEIFGERVADIVIELTDDKSLPKDERKRLQVEHAPHMSHAAKQIKLADKISNIHDITMSPPADWPQERLIGYVDWGEAVVEGLRGANEKLEAKFDKTAAKARERFSP